jgi:hypothetical protein
MSNGPSKTGRYSFPPESAAEQFLETLAAAWPEATPDERKVQRIRT